MNEDDVRITARRNASEQAAACANYQTDTQRILIKDSEYIACLAEEIFRRTYNLPPKPTDRPDEYDFLYKNTKIEVKTTPHHKLILNVNRPIKAYIYVLFKHDYDLDWAYMLGFATSLELESAIQETVGQDLCRSIHYSKLHRMDQLDSYLNAKGNDTP